MSVEGISLMPKSNTRSNYIDLDLVNSQMTDNLGLSLRWQTVLTDLAALGAGKNIFEHTYKILLNSVKFKCLRQYVGES